MRAIEQSALSRSSVNQSESKNRSNLINGSTGFLDRLFPFFDQLFQNSNLSILFHYIAVFIFIIQFYSISFWAVNVENAFPVDDSTKCGLVVQHIVSIFYLTPYEDGKSVKEANWLIPFLVYTICFVLTALVIAVDLISFAIKRRFIQYSFLFVQLFLEIINMIILIPLSVMCGETFVEIWNNSQAHDTHADVIIYFVFGLIYLLLLSFLFIFEIKLTANSAYIQQNPYASFQATAPQLIIISAIVFSFLSRFFKILSDWTVLVLIIIHLVVMVFVAYQLIYLPFIKLSSNIVAFGLVGGCVMNDLIVFIAYFAKAVKGWPIFVIGIVFGIACSIVYYFLEKKKKKQIHSVLDPKEVQQISDEEKNCLFDELKIKTSEKLACYTMEIGLVTGSEYFLDWSLLKYILSSFGSNEVACFCAQFLSYFPGESRLLNAVFANITKRRHLNLPQRFFVYQLNRIRSLRTSSSSKEAAEKLQQLTQTKHQINEIIRDFWLNIPSSTQIFSRLSQSISMSNVLWQEGIKNFPNSSRIFDEYSQYLIDCHTDFIEGIRMKRNSDLLDMNHNFSVDYSFKFFIRMYPFYIKKKLVDLHGNIHNDKNSSNASRSNSSMKSSNSSSSSNAASTTINAEMTLELEEQIGQQLFKYCRMRLALQRTLIGRSSKFLKLMNMMILISFFVSVACFTVYFVVVRGWFSNTQESLTRQLYAAHARFTASIATTCLSLEWGRYIGKFHPNETLAPLNEGEDEWQDFIDFGGDLIEYNILQSTKARSFFGQLLSSITTLAQSGVDVFQSSSLIISREVNTTFCDGDTAVEPILGPLASMFAFNGFMRTLVSAKDLSEWKNLSYLCYSFSNAKEQTNAFNSIYDSFYEEKLRETDDIWDKLKILLIIIPIIMFLVNALPIYIFIILFMKELKSLPLMFREVDSEARKNAAVSLCNQNDEEIKQALDSSKETFNVGLFIVVFATILINLAPIALIIGEVFYHQNLNKRFSIIHGWLYHGSARQPLIVEISMACCLSILARNGLESNFVNKDVQYASISTKTDELISNNDALLRGVSGQLPPSYEYDKIIDDIHFKEVCSIPNNATKVDVHDSYRCGSLNQNVIVMRGFVNDIKQKINIITDLNNDLVINLLHLVNNHMFQKIMEASDRTAQVAVELHNSSLNIMAAFYIAGLVLAVLIMVGMFLISKKLNGEYDAALVLVRRVQPQAIVANTKLINYLLNKKSKESNNEMTLSNAVFYNMDDAILCLSCAGIIEMVNPAVTKLLGFTPEQLLGQSGQSIFAPDSVEAVMNQINLIKNGQSASTFDDHTICITDSDVQLPCHITILGIKEDNIDEIKSLVVILRNETLLIQKQKEAEEAKKQSESLLFQILPQDIVMRLNQGEKDISFTVPSASIIFIDIVRFSDYASSLTPQQIMGNLSMIFAAFDEAAANLNLLTKIKLIGDVYMAASGLFNPDEQPKMHAEQMVQFGLDALSDMDELNIKLNSNLAVRIGVNSGGPILAGVLGTDKPVFDIIGDTINVAARLQSTCIPGHIQISQGTYDLVNEFDFAIEPRGEVFLKGKGKQMAYLVKPKTNSFKAVMDFDANSNSN